MKQAHHSIIGTALCKGWVLDPAGPTLEETSLAAHLCSALERVVGPHVAFPAALGQGYWSFSLWVARE